MRFLLLITLLFSLNTLAAPKVPPALIQIAPTAKTARDWIETQQASLLDGIPYYLYNHSLFRRGPQDGSGFWLGGRNNLVALLTFNGAVFTLSYGGSLDVYTVDGAPINVLTNVNSTIRQILESQKRLYALAENNVVYVLYSDRGPIRPLRWAQANWACNRGCWANVYVPVFAPKVLEFYTTEITNVEKLQKDIETQLVTAITRDGQKILLQ